MSSAMQGAIIEKYGTLTFTGKPSYLWLGAAPLVDPAGNVVTMPIVQFEIASVQSVITLEGTRVETWRVNFEVYAESISNSQNIAYGVLYNRQSPEDRAGFVMCDSFTMPTGYTFMACKTDTNDGPNTVDYSQINAAITNTYMTRFSLSIVALNTIT
jgi:hypothetical protein